ncbi:MAG: ABC transporter substrate-binding protein [Betaproteobacteria bacterium]|nr:ABC transporter substrate-binding protein [Betaproteobacteria bacterium]
MQGNGVTSKTMIKALVVAMACFWPFVATSEALPAITLSVPGPGAANFLPLALISKIGADRAEGVQVKLQYVSGGGVAAQEMLSNNTDFAAIGLSAAMSVRLKDSRIVALAAINDLPLYVLLVRSGLQGKVNSVADLKGRVIGVHSFSITSKTNSHIVIELLLRNAGVTPDSVRFVPVGKRWSSEAAMLADGTADAVMGDEPQASRAVADKIAFPLVHLGDPQTASAIPGAAFLRGALFGREDRIEQDPKKAETMVRVIRRTLEWIASHTPEEVVDMAGIEDPAERKFMLATMRKYPRQYSRDAKFSTRQLQETEIFFHKSQADNSAAQALKVESMIVDRWAGRKP